MKRLLQMYCAASRPYHIIVLSLLVVALLIPLVSLLVIEPQAAVGSARPLHIVTLVLMTLMLGVEFASYEGTVADQKKMEGQRKASVAMMYYRYIQKKHLLLGLILIVVGQLLYFASMFVGRTDPATFSCVLIVPPLLYALTSIRRAILHLRVVSGLFGTTELEVREFVDFMAKHHQSIDLSGEGGASIPTLEPELRRHNLRSGARGITEILG